MAGWSTKWRLWPASPRPYPSTSTRECGRHGFSLLFLGTGKHAASHGKRVPASGKHVHCSMPPSAEPPPAVLAMPAAALPCLQLLQPGGPGVRDRPQPHARHELVSQLFCCDVGKPCCGSVGGPPAARQCLTPSLVLLHAMRCTRRCPAPSRPTHTALPPCCAGPTSCHMLARSPCPLASSRRWLARSTTSGSPRSWACM